jgi:hypothetical protein
MEWDVLFDPDFEAWLREQESSVRISITAAGTLLRAFGPALGRPQVDTLKGSRLPNLKELRVQHRGTPWRVLFIFDPKRRAILLVGGHKQGNQRWYKTAIPLAEQRYRRHLKLLEKDDGTHTR